MGDEKVRRGTKGYIVRGFSHKNPFLKEKINRVSLCFIEMILGFKKMFFKNKDEYYNLYSKTTLLLKED